MIVASYIGDDIFIKYSGDGEGDPGVKIPVSAKDSVRQFEKAYEEIRLRAGLSQSRAKLALFIPDADFKIFSLRDPMLSDELKTRNFVEWHIKSKKYFDSYEFDFQSFDGKIYGLVYEKNAFDSALSVCGNCTGCLESVDVQIMREFKAIFKAAGNSCKTGRLLVKILKKDIAVLYFDRDGYCDSVCFQHGFDELDASRGAEGFGADAVALVHEAVAKLRAIPGLAAEKQLANGACELFVLNASFRPVPYYFELHSLEALGAVPFKCELDESRFAGSPAGYPGFNISVMCEGAIRGNGEKQ